MKIFRWRARECVFARDIRHLNGAISAVFYFLFCSRRALTILHPDFILLHCLIYCGSGNNVRIGCGYGWSREYCMSHDAPTKTKKTTMSIQRQQTIFRNFYCSSEWHTVRMLVACVMLRVAAAPSTSRYVRTRIHLNNHTQAMECYRNP